jgi:hypothetical protein
MADLVELEQRNEKTAVVPPFFSVESDFGLEGDTRIQLE